MKIIKSNSFLIEIFIINPITAYSSEGEPAQLLMTSILFTKGTYRESTLGAV